ncbi:hypothetical protein HPP92_001156 [Vanilla planifolia]|uniref:UDP-glycosyltransferase n=1 Tax=Vanilla planifolia TaxID=51239 RepID=A0A835VGS7_VANPL|nr:hypothetical protein HPP92_001156 [Vanilla planifolia]
MSSSPHALVFPYPAQGHVIPLMELSFRLLDRGFKVTFLNTDYNHERVVSAMKGKGSNQIRMASIPDGFGPEESRSDLGRLTESIAAVMPKPLENLIMEEKNKFTCFIADTNMPWAFAIAKKMAIRTAAFFQVLQEETCQLSLGVNPVSSLHLPWNCFHDELARKAVFQTCFKTAEEFAEEIVICNSFEELEKPIFELYSPRIKPIGPLLATLRSEAASIGSFWSQERACITWLDNQLPKSVIYVAFGSFTVINHKQFHELALGLELTGRPFLWVVRPGFTEGTVDEDAYPLNFKERVLGRGHMVSWVPQQHVLQHPSIACFISHCGWNSTIEGVTNGVPFLSWPYFGDQFFDQDYICDIWKIGLGLVPDENGVIRREQIIAKVEELLGDEDIKSRSLALKGMAHKSVKEGGSSFENLNSFVDAMRGD